MHADEQARSSATAAPPIQPGSSGSEPMDIRAPALAKVVGDVSNLCIWEALRRLRKPSSAATIAAIVHRSSAAVQASLDALEGVGLVERIRAGRNRRLTTWRVTRPSIVVAYREGDSVDETLREQMFEGIDRLRQREVQERIKPFGERVPGKEVWTVSRTQLKLSRDQLRELWEMLRQLQRWLDVCSAASASDPVPPAGDATWDCNYHIGVDLHPLHQGILPIAAVQIVSTRSVGYWSPVAVDPALPQLSTRERAIADRFVAGQTKQQIAEALELSPNTIATYTKRIYRKLAVKSRTELALVLRSPV
jgi:DNA-binding CsgD family transcriptional regulator/DNA-binding MarR family transcriptional regulator